MVKIRTLAIKILAQLYNCRGKSKLAFADQVSRVLQNINIFLSVLKPRNFDADDLLREIPKDQTFSFAFELFILHTEDANKLTIKDFATRLLNLPSCERELVCLFSILNEMLTTTRKAQVEIRLGELFDTLFAIIR
jgi:hypothetical protein